jgi:hypothetical protein
MCVEAMPRNAYCLALIAAYLDEDHFSPRFSCRSLAKQADWWPGTTSTALVHLHAHGSFVISGKTPDLFKHTVDVPVVLVVRVKDGSEISAHVGPAFAPSSVVDRSVSAFLLPAAITAILFLPRVALAAGWTHNLHERLGP